MDLKRIHHWSSTYFFVRNNTWNGKIIFLTVQYLTILGKRVSSEQKQSRYQTICGIFRSSSNVQFLGVRIIHHWSSTYFFVRNNTWNEKIIFLTVQFLTISGNRVSPEQNKFSVIVFPVVYWISNYAKKTDKWHHTKVERLHQPITLVKHEEAKENILPYKRLHCTFHSTPSWNIACVNKFHENELYMWTER